MGVKNLESVIGRLRLEITSAKTEKTERAITEMLIDGGANAATLTPVDRANLINSQGRKTWTDDKGMGGAVYYGAAYAPAVHEMSGKLKGKPRAHFGVTSNHSNAGPQKPKEFGGGSGKGNYWDPDAEPHFLKKGMEEMAKDSAVAILKKVYSV